MCIVCDPPALLAVFKPDHEKHSDFSAVKDWVLNGPGKLVIGGSQYKAELGRLRSLVPLIAELSRKRKIVSANDAAVDDGVAELKRVEPSTDFDDPHLVAIARETRCKLIGVIDPRSHRFLRRTDFYKQLKDRPSLYTRAKNAHLLCTRNIASCCR